MKKEKMKVTNPKIKIERNIPIPTEKGRKYPFEAMRVGDSFYVEGVKHNSLSGIATATGYRIGMKFMVRRWKTGLRCWRIK